MYRRTLVINQGTFHQSELLQIRREGNEQDQAQEASSQKAICDDDG
jgi:hypothetical protein